MVFIHIFIPSNFLPYDVRRRRSRNYRLKDVAPSYSSSRLASRHVYDVAKEEVITKRSVARHSKISTFNLGLSLVQRLPTKKTLSTSALVPGVHNTIPRHYGNMFGSSLNTEINRSV
ncbi:hypothetical protein TNCV_4520701 [Trichonephila clavipes]|nr:hypothetical protein TNCV_4520701 [Trichonephila clavipes]